MYGKHFASMYTGSMVGAGFSVFAVWGYAIAHERKGLVELNPKLMSFILGGSEREVEEAIERLCVPDPASRSEVEEGRRLIKEGTILYRMVNWEAYAHLANEAERRAYKVNWQREDRAKARTNEDSGGQLRISQTKTETETDTKTKEEKSSSNTLQSQSLRTAHKSILVDQEYLDLLSKKLPYSALGMETLVKEAYKFKNWCEANGRMKSRKRFINWLNKIT